MTNRAQPDPAALEMAAKELRGIAQQLMKVSRETQAYHQRIGPIAEELRRTVGGSSTGKDKDIAGAIRVASSDVQASAGASAHASTIANRLADTAQTDANRARRDAEKTKQGPRR
ncbi:MAG: hypothetical protein ABWX74_21025 [Aeromicrobium sp.]